MAWMRERTISVLANAVKGIVNSRPHRFGSSANRLTNPTQRFWRLIEDIKGDDFTGEMA